MKMSSLDEMKRLAYRIFRTRSQCSTLLDVLDDMAYYTTRVLCLYHGGRHLIYLLYNATENTSTARQLLIGYISEAATKFLAVRLRDKFTASTFEVVHLFCRTRWEQIFAHWALLGSKA